MPWKIVNFEKAPVGREAIEEFLNLLPKRLTDNLQELSYQSADNLDLDRRVQGIENHKVRGLHYNQDGKHSLVVVGPTLKASDFDRLSFVGHLKWVLLKLFTSRVPWSEKMHCDLAHYALSVSPTQATYLAWRQALANRLYANGHDVDHAIKFCDQIYSLLKEDGYDVGRSVYNLADWQNNIVKNFARRTIKGLINQTNTDSYERAKLMHTIFLDGACDFEPGLLDQLRLLVERGDPHRIVAVRHFANALNEI